MPKRLLGTITKNNDSGSSLGYDKVTTNIINCFFYIVIIKRMSVLQSFSSTQLYQKK